MVFRQAGIAYERSSLDESVLVEGVIRTAAGNLVPTCRHLVPQADAQREVRLQLHFILNIPGCLRGTESEQLRVRLALEVRAGIGQEILERGVGHLAGFVGAGAVGIGLDLLQPSSEAPRMRAADEVQIVGPGIEISNRRGEPRAATSGDRTAAGSA